MSLSKDHAGLTEEMKTFILEGGVISCSDLHEGTCLTSALLRTLNTVPKCWKYYLPIHLIPFLIFKRKKVMQKCLEIIYLVLWRLYQQRHTITLNPFCLFHFMLEFANTCFAKWRILEIKSGQQIQPSLRQWRVRHYYWNRKGGGKKFHFSSFQKL